MTRGCDPDTWGVLFVGLGGLVPLGSSAKQERFWCDFLGRGLGDLGQGCVSRFDPAGSRTWWVDVTLRGGVSLHSGH
jgi:hypothetical protein